MALLGSADGPVAVGNHEFIMNLLFTSPTTAIKNWKQFVIRGTHIVQIYNKNKKVRSVRRRERVVSTNRTAWSLTLNSEFPRH